MHISSIKPKIEVTLENGISNLLTKKLRYEKMMEDSEIRLKFQLVTASMFWKLG